MPSLVRSIIRELCDILIFIGFATLVGFMVFFAGKLIKIMVSMP